MTKVDTPNASLLPDTFPAIPDVEVPAVNPTGRHPKRGLDPAHRLAQPCAARGRRGRARADRANGTEADRDAADVSGRGLDRWADGGPRRDAVRSGPRFGG